MRYGGFDKSRGVMRNMASVAANQHLYIGDQYIQVSDHLGTLSFSLNAGEVQKLFPRAPVLVRITQKQQGVGDTFEYWGLIYRGTEREFQDEHRIYYMGDDELEVGDVLWALWDEKGRGFVSAQAGGGGVLHQDYDCSTGSWSETVEAAKTIRFEPPLDGEVNDGILTVSLEYNPTADSWITLSENGSCELEVKHNNPHTFTTSISTITGGTGDGTNVNVSSNVLRFDAKGHFAGTTTEDINLNLNLDIPEVLDDLDDVSISNEPDNPVEGSILYHDGDFWRNLNPPDDTNSHVLVYDGSKAAGSKLDWLQLIDFACPSS